MSTDWDCVEESINENLQDGMDDDEATTTALYE